MSRTLPAMHPFLKHDYNVTIVVLQSMCSEQDLKDLGLPMGPRKKLQLLLQEEKGNKVSKQSAYVFAESYAQICLIYFYFLFLFSCWRRMGAVETGQGEECDWGQVLSIENKDN